MKRKTIITSVLAVVISGLPLANARLSSNDRRSVVLEAFHALRQSADGGCNQTIGTNCVSSWNYLNDDGGAFNVVRSYYQPCYASDWAYTYESCYAGYSSASFYANLAYYGYYANYGRGGQCKFFSNLVLYRSGAYTAALPNYPSMTSNVEPDLTRAVPGDVLFRYNSAYVNHVAIVVEIKKDSSGHVTGLDIIDSNFLTDNGSLNREVIGRHLVSLSDPQSFVIWKGVSYYSQPYIP